MLQRAKAVVHVAAMAWALVGAHVAEAADALAAPFPNSRRIDVQGVALHARDWPATDNALPERSARCPVLLVHALAGSTYSFRHLAPELADAGHRVLAIDLPGYGYSARRPFDGSAARALWQLLEVEAPGVRWCLVGHSMGARVVGQMVAEAPQRVGAVAYLSGSPVRERRRNPSMFRAQPLRGLVLSLAERRYLRREGLAEVLEEGFGRAPEAAELDAYLAPLHQPGTLPAILDGYARDMGPDRTDAAGLVDPPSLVLWGERDRWLKPEVGEALAAALPNARWVLVAGAAHSPMETHPASVVPPVLELLAKATPGVDARVGAVSPAGPAPSSP
ncbi:MAG: alpha/beta fold hydrolase [Silanimonas sp.]